MAPERKAQPSYTKDISGRKVSGIASVFGNLDSYDDVVWPGAFAKTLQERGNRIIHLWQHDMASPPIAKIVSLQEVGRDALPDEVLRRSPEALGGLEVVREYLQTPRADEVLSNLTAGVPLEMSFAFDAVRYDFQELEGAKYEWERQRNLRELRLWETSDVNWGANSATVASKTPIDLDAWLHAFSTFVRDVKEGRRNANGDLERINTIAKLALELGANNVKLIELEEAESEDDAAKAHAADSAPEPSTSPRHAEEGRKLYGQFLRIQAQLQGVQV